MRGSGTAGNAYTYSTQRADDHKISGAYISQIGWAYLRVEIMLVYPSPPTDRALECVCLILCSTVAWAPRAFAASMQGSNTRSIGAGERARGRTEGGQEVFLVVVGGADVVYEVVADVLCAQRASSGLS